MGVYFREFDGYGHSGLEMVNALLDLGVDVRPRAKQPSIDPTLPEAMRTAVEKLVKREPVEAPVVVYYALPSLFYELPDYQVGFTQFETNRLPEYWIEDLERMDEVWVTCKELVDVFSKSGVTRPIYVTRLGVRGDRFTPARRKKTKPFRFVHTGMPEPRKGADLVLKAYRLAFGGYEDEVRLTMKGVGIPQDWMNRLPLGVDFILSRYPTKLLVDLYHNSHCMVYPTRGEGWGMIPMEAMATGLPTILTSFLGTSEFAKYGIKVGHKLVEAEYYEHLMPCGEWAQPDLRELADLMIDVYDNYEKYEDAAFTDSREMVKEFSWENTAKQIRGHLERIEEVTHDKSSCADGACW